MASEVDDSSRIFTVKLFDEFLILQSCIEGLFGRGMIQIFDHELHKIWSAKCFTEFHNSESSHVATSV